MSRMPQKLLIILLIMGFCLTSRGEAASLKLKLSLEKGPEGRNLYHPLGIYHDPHTGRFYVADTGNNRLLSFKIDGTPLKSFNAAGQLKGPYSMVRDAEGRLWVVERPLNSLTKIDLKAQRLERHSLSYQGKPVLVDRLLLWKGKLMVLDRASGRILTYDQDLQFLRAFYPKQKDFRGFFDFKIKDDTLWGLENMSGRLFAIDLQSGETLKIIKPLFPVALPVAFELDGLGNFYLLDRYLKKVFVFDETGRLRHQLFKRGYLPGELNYPWQLLILKGELIVLDEGNGRIDIWGH